MDRRVVISICFLVTLIYIVSSVSGAKKKVVIHVPYKIKKLKHTHTIYKTIHHHHHKPVPVTVHRLVPHRGHEVAASEEHEHFHHHHIHDEPHGQHSQQSQQIASPQEDFKSPKGINPQPITSANAPVPEYIPIDIPIGLPIHDMTRHIVSLYRRDSKQ